jgi:hypothetical protein
VKKKRTYKFSEYDELKNDIYEIEEQLYAALKRIRDLEKRHKIKCNELLYHGVPYRFEKLVKRGRCDDRLPKWNNFTIIGKDRSTR